MNATTIITVTFSILIYGLLIHHLFSFPKKVFVSMRKQLLQSLDSKKPMEWMHNSYNDVEKANSLWNYFQDRSIKILGNKKRELCRIIFIQGGFVLFPVLIFLILITTKNDFGVDNFLPSNFLLYFTLFQIPIFFVFYFWHLKRFDRYMIKGGQEKFIEEVKDHLAKLQHDAEDKFFDKHS